MTVEPFTRKVHFYETDAAGIVHHSNYARWFEEARIDYLEKIGFPYEKVAEKGIHFILLGVSCEFKNMIRFGDTIQISIAAKFLSPLKMFLEYKVMKSGQLCATGTTSSCAYHMQQQKLVSMKKEMPEFYNLFAND